MQQMILQNAADQSDFVCFRIGEQDYCIDIEVVREIRGWTPATVLPHSPRYVTGVISLSCWIDSPFRTDWTVPQRRGWQGPCGKGWANR